MTSYRLKNTTPPKSVTQLVGEVVKTSDTVIPRSTSFTIDSSDSSSPLDDPVGSFETSPVKVRRITEDILRTANNNLDDPSLKSSRDLADCSRPESKAPSMDQVAQNEVFLDKSIMLDPVYESRPPTRYSRDEIKEMVLQSIPDQVRTKIPSEKWNAVLDEAMESTLSKEIMCLENNPTEEDIKDLVSFISIYIQREARANPPPTPSKKAKARKSKTGPQMVDAMTLVLESLGATIAEEKDSKGKITKETNKQNGGTEHKRRGSSSVPATVTASTTSKQAPSNHSRPTTNILPGYIPKLPTERTIGFSRVQIRYYEQILSDNPSVTSGPPIGIGWKYRVMKQDLSVDAWEYKQQPSRRYLTALLTTREDRMTLLCNLGYTQREIAVAVREVLRVKNNRIQTFNNARLEGMEEAIERTTRRLKNVLTLGMANRQEKKLLGPYVTKKSKDKTTSKN